MVRKTIALLLFLVFCAPPSLWAAQVIAVADHDRLGAGESLQLELRVQGSADGDADLTPLARDWEVLNRSQSSQMQIINGSFNRSQVVTLSLIPRRSGNLEIPAICFGADCSAPLPIQVSKESAAPTAGAAPLLLEAEVEPRQVLVGSQVVLTVRVLHRVDLAQASLSEPQPQGVEAEIQQLGKDRAFEVRRDGTLYRAIERRYALFPQRAGTLHLPPLQLDAQIASAASGLNPFGRSLKQVRRTSQPLDIRVDSPPADLGGRPWLPARNLTVQDDWQQQVPSLRVGEPATRTLTVRASGLPAAHLPELRIPLPAGWKSYPDQPARQDDSDAAGVAGTLRQKLALVPTQPGPVELPAIDLDWYDVTTRQWRRAHLNPLRVTVAPAAAGTIAAAPPAAPSPAPPPQTAPTPSPAPPLPEAAAASHQSSGFWPWLALCFGLGWLLTLLLFWKSRRQPPPPRNQPPRTGHGRDQEALEDLWRATGRNDPKAAREALLAWSRQRWPTAGHHDLERLAKLCDEPLAGELAALGRALYAPSPGGWQGATLADGVRRWLQEQERAAPPEALPLLYPEPRSGP